MNGEMKRYREHVRTMPDPIMPSQIPPVKMDLQGLMKYAKKQGKKVIELTDEEKNKFIS